MLESKEKISQIALSQVKGIGNAMLKRLIAKMGSARAVFQSSPKALTQTLGGNYRLAQEILHKNTLSQGEAILLAHEKAAIGITTLQEDIYPSRLRRMPDAPFIIYTRGNIDLNAHKVISIVGTRKATAYGKRVVETIIEDLIEHSVTIVSGLAYGIDIHAHRKALECSLPTVGVLAGGLNHIYPKSHKSTAIDMIRRRGCLLSEHPIQAQPEARYFAARNRIIAGIADATIVVEAGEKSGALITAHFANEYHREVFAVPGDIYNSYSKGCHQLINNHQAHLLSGISDVVRVMNWDQQVPRTGNLRLSVSDRLRGLSDPEKSIVETLEQMQKEVPMDELSYQASVPHNQMAGILLGLEVKKVIKFMPGKKYRLAV